MAKETIAGLTRELAKAKDLLESRSVADENRRYNISKTLGFIKNAEGGLVVDTQSWGTLHEAIIEMKHSKNIENALFQAHMKRGDSELRRVWSLVRSLSGDTTLQEEIALNKVHNRPSDIGGYEVKDEIEI